MKKNYFIYLTSFICGMCVMGVELSATRLLAPYFGTSSIVYTIVIGLIMIAMSIGNILGGRSADKHNNLGRLFMLLWVAALWVTVIPLVGKYVIALSALIMTWLLPGNLLVAGSSLACLLVFSAPLLILGMVSPYLVKLGVKDMENTGRTTGKIYAANTIGSIIGTFIPTFLTIPHIGTLKSFLVFALTLNLICLYYFITEKKGFTKAVITTVITVAMLIMPINSSYAFWADNIVLEDESLYNYLQITEDEDSVILSTNVAFGVQSIYKKNQMLSGMYYDYALMSPLFLKDMEIEKPLDVLVLGMGTGTFAKQCKYYFPNSKIEGVEIDEKIVNLSREYFELKPDEATVYVNDGRTFLSGPDAGMYDIVMVDAYHDITIPFHMSTAEFFSEIKEHLNPGGIIMININMRSENSTEIVDYLTQTLKTAVNKVYKYNVPNTTNTIVFSSDNMDCLQDFESNAEQLDDQNPLLPLANRVLKNQVEVTDMEYVFTDDMAPVEKLGQKVLNDIVLESLDYYKQQWENSEGSILDMLDMIS